MKRVLPVLAAVLLALVVAVPAGASAEAFRAAGPGAMTAWSTVIDGKTVWTGILVFRQNGSRGPLVIVNQQDGGSGGHGFASPGTRAGPRADLPGLL